MTLMDLIELYQIYKLVRKSSMIKNLISSCKSYAIEDIDSVSIRETLVLMEMY